MAKINLLTIHYSDNYGAVLQAYATCRILKHLGHDVTLLNLQNSKTVIGKYSYWRNWFCILKYIRFFLFRKRYLAKQTRLFFHLKPSLIPFSDYTIVGSDQVWNPDFEIVKNCEYFLNFVQDGSRKISLASSFGIKEWHAVPSFTENVNKLLSDFTAVSVREKAGVDICNNTFSIHAVQLVDPVLALNDFSQFFNQKSLQSNELRCYLFKTVYSFDVIDYIAKKEKLIVRAENRHSKPDYKKSLYWSYSPIDWLREIRDSHIWVSDSFHGIACAIVLHKQFVALCADVAKIERITSMLELFGLSEKLVMSLDDLIYRYEEVMAPIDYDKVDVILKSEQMRFYDFVKTNII